MKRFITFLVIGLLLLLACLHGDQGFRYLWRSLLIVSVPMEKADALIVLGGEALGRPLEAARLFHDGVAPEIFVTGVGDAVANSRVLVSHGVPSSAITLESKATTTYTNALLLKPLLERAHIRTALIITSPFHTRRALATFQKVIPEVRFGVMEASIEWWKTPSGILSINHFALIEFLKIAEYWILYGISPMVRTF